MTPRTKSRMFQTTKFQVRNRDRLAKVPKGRFDISPGTVADLKF